MECLFGSDFLCALQSTPFAGLCFRVCVCVFVYDVSDPQSIPDGCTKMHFEKSYFPQYEKRQPTTRLSCICVSIAAACTDTVLWQKNYAKNNFQTKNPPTYTWYIRSVGVRCRRRGDTKGMNKNALISFPFYSLHSTCYAYVVHSYTQCAINMHRHVAHKNKCIFKVH